MGGTIYYLVKKFGKQVADGLDEYSQVIFLVLILGHVIHASICYISNMVP